MLILPFVKLSVYGQENIFEIESEDQIGTVKVKLKLVSGIENS